MVKRVSLISLIGILFIVAFGFVLSQKETGSIDYEARYLDSVRLKSLSLASETECLQDSQCLDDYGCMANKCVIKDSIDYCQEFKLSTSISNLKVGSPINVDKEIISESQMPSLLSSGKFVEIFKDKPLEYDYIFMIVVGDSLIGQDSADFFIIPSGSEKPIYTFKVVFSNGVDFSSETIKGQTIKILGEEYVIGSASTNSVIYLISKSKKIKLEDKRNAIINTEKVDNSAVNFVKDYLGNIISIEFPINGSLIPGDNIKVGEKVAHPVFDAVKISFNGMGPTGVADIKIGGNC